MRGMVAIEHGDQHGGVEEELHRVRSRLRCSLTAVSTESASTAASGETLRYTQIPCSLCNGIWERMGRRRRISPSQSISRALPFAFLAYGVFTGGTGPPAASPEIGRA